MTKSSGCRNFDGFTLIEVLLVLALVGVLLGLVAGNVGGFILGSQFEPPDRVLKKAVLDAIYEASESKESTYLSYLEENASFLGRDSSGVLIRFHNIFDNLSEQDDVPKVIFRAIGPEAGPDGSATIYDEDELFLNRVPFHYGSSVPFEVEIEFREKETRLQFDPFSGFVLRFED